MPRQDFRNRPVHAALIDLENDAITDRQLPFLLTLLLESASKRRFMRLSGVGADVPYSACSFEHDTFRARQLLPSLRIESHHGSSSLRLALIRPSSFNFTSLSDSAPTILRASSSVAAKARKSVSRCPVATGSPWPQRPNSK